MSEKKILVVEDDEGIARSIEEILKSEGYAVEMAENGKVAFERLAASPITPSLILLDLMMPVMDGFEFRKQQEMDPRFSTIPIVVMTADGNIEVKKARVGATAFLRKPINIRDFLSTVERYSV